MPYEVFRKNFFAHMNELEITPGKVRLDEAIRLIVQIMLKRNASSATAELLFHF